jgi:Protein of unknown function (DUF2950)
MFSLVRTRSTSASPLLSLVIGFTLFASLTACKKQEQAPAQPVQKTFDSPESAGKALAEAAKTESPDAVLDILGPGSADIVSTGDAAEDKTALAGFADAYQVMHRWRKLSDTSSVLIVGADNQAFPIPLTKASDNQWHFDVPAGKKEIQVRLIGRNELATIYVCGALVQSQQEYFAQKHGGVKQYAQKFISDPGQQNGLYWEAPAGAPRSPLGPLVALATEEGLTLKPNQAQAYYGYFYRRLDGQDPSAKGGTKQYIVDGKMTGGFAYLAYPAQYGKTGLKTFQVDQDGVVFEKDLGADTTTAAKAITTFNPDQTWTELK